jgi:hypothetical protein
MIRGMYRSAPVFFVVLVSANVVVLGLVAFAFVSAAGGGC